MGRLIIFIEEIWGCKGRRNSFCIRFGYHFDALFVNNWTSFRLFSLFKFEISKNSYIFSHNLGDKPNCLCSMADFILVWIGSGGV